MIRPRLKASSSTIPNAPATAMNHVFPVATQALGRGTILSSHVLRPPFASIACIRSKYTALFSTDTRACREPQSSSWRRRRDVQELGIKFPTGQRYKSSKTPTKKVIPAKRPTSSAPKASAPKSAIPKPKSFKSPPPRPISVAPASTPASTPPKNDNIAPPPNPKQVNLSSKDVLQIFGPGLTFEKGMYVLQELQTRRVTGSLADIGIAFPDQPEITDLHATKGLSWLRSEYPIDEEAAAAEWAEEEIAKLEGSYLKRAEELHLYKRTPEEEKKEEIDDTGRENEAVEVVEEKITQIQQHSNRGLYGESVLEARQKELKAQEEAKAAARELEAEEKGVEVQHQPYKGHEIIVRQAAELDDRRQRKKEYKERLAAAAELPTEQILMNRSAFSRLWAPYLFGTAIVLASVAWASVYIPPLAENRLFTSIPPSVTTIGTIIAMNFAVFVLWKRPEMWRTMNRYFLLSSGHPNAFSIVGNIFSHQTFRHFGSNMFWLVVLGGVLHDELTRAPFLAVFLLTGVAGALTSLTYAVLTKDLLLASVGASGAAYGLIGTFLTITPTRWFGIAFPTRQSTPLTSFTDAPSPSPPPSAIDTPSPENDHIGTLDEFNAVSEAVPTKKRYGIDAPGWTVLVVLFVFESVSFWRTRKGRALSGGSDHLAHLGGLVSGAAVGWGLRYRGGGGGKEGIKGGRES
ncbi:hypothetical protein EJ08DRAFT_678619 [Tothia fuscella]|uniref:Peptidase S54 rhomboid domain-containing protein n=1 Tax=Tothia fuscella TaxID=1048955 RepID=A0A9P4TZ62_9PEZI|nr:hypothetical protein EJ08DRAFT_678619 [Tothia fuscella]